MGGKFPDGHGKRGMTVKEGEGGEDSWELDGGVDDTSMDMVRRMVE